MSEVIARFVKEKETKNTVRFQEVGPNPKIGTLYLQKSELDKIGGWQDINEVRVTVTAPEETA